MKKYSTDYLIPYNNKEGAFTQDALFLSWFPERNPGKICELGTGTGIISIILALRFPDSLITAIDIIPDMTEAAQKNVLNNHLESRITVFTEDLKTFDQKGFDTVVMNPPFVKKGHGRSCKSQIRDAARNERFCTLDDIVRCSRRILNPEGHLYLVYPVDRFEDVVETCDAHGMYILRIRFIHTNFRQSAERFMIEAACKYEGFHVMYPLVIYENNSITEEAQRILTGAGL